MKCSCSENNVPIIVAVELYTESVQEKRNFRNVSLAVFFSLNQTINHQWSHFTFDAKFVDKWIWFNAVWLNIFIINVYCLKITTWDFYVWHSWNRFNCRILTICTDCWLPVNNFQCNNRFFFFSFHAITFLIWSFNFRSI